MRDASRDSEPKWDEQNSVTFLDLGRYYVPEREYQLEAICDLIPANESSFDILELCCGEGLLAQTLLARFPQCKILALDGSPIMLEHARRTLASFGDRFIGDHFDLAAKGWRDPNLEFQAIVSTLAIHHLDDQEKQLLYQDLYHMLRPGGVLIISDIIRAANIKGNNLAAKAWDEAVRKRALELDGDLSAFERFKQDGWNMFCYFDDVDKPSRLYDQLRWLDIAGFQAVDVYWMKAGHVIFGGEKPRVG